MKYTPRQLARDALAKAKKTPTWERLKSENRLPATIEIPSHCPKVRKKLDSEGVLDIIGFASRRVNKNEYDFGYIQGQVLLRLDSFTLPPIMLVFMTTTETGNYFRDGMQELAGLIAQCAQKILETKPYVVRFCTDGDVLEEQRFDDVKSALETGINWRYAEEYEEGAEPECLEVLRDEGGKCYSLFWQNDNGDVSIEVKENDPDYALTMKLFKDLCD